MSSMREKKYIAFTDSRQGTATSAQAINNDMERVWLRSEIFRRLYKLGEYKREQPEKITKEEEEKLSKWKDSVRDDPETYSEVSFP